MEQVRILQVRIVQQVRILRIGLPLDDHAEPFHLCLTARHLVARRVAVSRDVPFVVYEVRPTRHAPPGLRLLVNQARLVNPLADRAVPTPATALNNPDTSSVSIPQTSWA